MVKLGNRYFVMGGESNKIEEYDVAKRIFVPAAVGLLAEHGGGFAGVVEVPTKYFTSLPDGCGGVDPVGFPPLL